MIPTLRPIKVNEHRGKIAAKLVLPARHYHKDKSDSNFIKKAIIASLFLHAVIFVIRTPEHTNVVPEKEKLASIKMNFIEPSAAYKKEKKLAEKAEAAKVLTMTDPGVKVVTTNAAGKTGDPTQALDQKVQKSKAGSAKKDLSRALTSQEQQALVTPLPKDMSSKEKD